ncbi:hypothetical protein BJ508DRAFT_326805 [Ascobolus immersus RN42]|uniref:Uncharacterized protein n=1 Tax=Ascobolus immersus RN42 TaxID=1160509 RepID=A0A3N4I697_ASCIM|nr:hypothetical protein BJ508DRAFT_326805 [Ascobolus immersus RN42]
MHFRSLFNVVLLALFSAATALPQADTSPNPTAPASLDPSASISSSAAGPSTSEVYNGPSSQPNSPVAPGEGRPYCYRYPNTPECVAARYAASLTGGPEAASRLLTAQTGCISAAFCSSSPAVEATPEATLADGEDVEGSGAGAAEEAAPTA